MDILLGMVDTEIPHDSDVAWDCNKIGGTPTWIKEGIFAPICKLCDSPLTLLVQMYCPLAGSSYHRVLYIFTCVRGTCQGNPKSWRVFRSQILDENYRTDAYKASPVTSQGADNMLMDNVQDDCTIIEDDGTHNTMDWGIGEDNWSDDEESGSSVQCPAPTQDASLDFRHENCENLLTEAMISRTEGDLRELSMSGSSGEKVCGEEAPIFTHRLNGESYSQDNDATTDSSPIMRFVPHYLYVEDEESAASRDVSKHLKSLIREYEQRQGKIVQEEDLHATRGATSESYEKTLISHGDTVFHKFHKKVLSCPQQCIRYQWSGIPLYNTQPSQGALHMIAERCQHCGAERVFELQLMPALISALKPSVKGAGVAGNGIDFGTVLIYTCVESCWHGDSDTLREEGIILMEDADQHLFVR